MFWVLNVLVGGGRRRIFGIFSSAHTLENSRAGLLALSDRRKAFERNNLQK